MRRLSGVRIVIAGLALLAAAAVSGCSSAPGLARAAAAGSAVPAAPAATARIPDTGKLAGTQGLGADLVVPGAPGGGKAMEGVLADPDTGQILWSQARKTERPIASI